MVLLRQNITGVIFMTCPKCQSNNVSIQTVSITKSKGKGCFYWIFIGWWLEFFMWLFLTLPMLFFKLFGGGKKVKTKVKKIAVCQNCGHNWKI